MKRLLIGIGVLLLLAAGAALAADVSSLSRFPGTTEMTGRMRSVGAPCYVDNAARSLDNIVATAGGTWKGGTDNTVEPYGVFLYCLSTNVRWTIGGPAPTATVGTPLPHSTGWHFRARNLSTMRFFPNTATDNVTCFIVMEY